MITENAVSEYMRRTKLFYAQLDLLCAARYQDMADDFFNREVSDYHYGASALADMMMTMGGEMA